MAEITASTVQKLRKMSGQGMMDCKKALEESNGDMDKAMEILRKKGLATLAKRAGRETTEGRVICKTSDDGKTIALVTLCCETDFVAKSDDFIEASNQVGEYALACSAEEGVDNVLQTAIEGKTLNDLITEIVSKIGEKIQVGDFAKYTHDGNAIIGTYVHFNQKVGTMVLIETGDEKTADAASLKTAGTDIAMHITAVRPLALDKDGIDPKTLESEKAIFAEQVKNKPANIIDKIVEGKLNKFYAENCLLQQKFVKDDSKTVSQVIADAAKEAGGQAKIVKFVRFSVG